MPEYRSRTTTHGRDMAGARSLWRATGMTDADFEKPIIAVANSFTQVVPGHVHLKYLGQLVAREIEKTGGVDKEFNTIGLVEEGDIIDFDIPNRSVNLRLSADELRARRDAMEVLGREAWKPKSRKRSVSQALRA